MGGGVADVDGAPGEKMAATVGPTTVLRGCDPGASKVTLTCEGQPCT